MASHTFHHRYAVRSRGQDHVRAMGEMLMNQDAAGNTPKGSSLIGSSSSMAKPDNKNLLNRYECLKTIGQDQELVRADTLMNQDAAGNTPESSSSVKKLDNVDLLNRYESFKKFDVVVGLTNNHHYAKQISPMKKPPREWVKKIQEEWRILEKGLPDTIFVRTYESRMDLLRVAIIGAEGTPYHDGLFFFDVCFPSDYPHIPPLVHYHSRGLHMNPNLYKHGKVCLSLLNTWVGQREEKWMPGTSTMLQLLVSIQGLILNTKPYFNEPGYWIWSRTPIGKRLSSRYNENTFILTLKTMIYNMNDPPKHFEELVGVHFRKRVRDILMACKAYKEGVEVGCFIRGDVVQGNNGCSTEFKNDVAAIIKKLVGAFEKIGANEAREFIGLGEKISRLSISESILMFIQKIVDWFLNF